MKTCIQNSLLAALLFFSLTQTVRAVPGFTITPAAVSNTYSGSITLQVTNVPTGDTVVVQKFLDANTNGVIDAGDLLVQQFDLTDGQAGMVIGGVTNFNVPGDLNSTTGAITATLNFQNGDFVQNIAGKYSYKLSSPVGDFSPTTNLFTVTNFPYAQTITGSVVSNGTSVTIPNAIVVLFPPPRGGNHGPGTPVAGTVADNSGSYTIQAPPGTYVPLALRSNYVANYSASPVLTLGSGGNINTNLTMTGATASISGQIVDANNMSVGLPGVFEPATSSGGLIAVAFTDTNGNFTEQVASGNWSIGSDDSGLIVHGYVGYQDGTNVTAGGPSVILAYSKATALVYGSVKDNSGNPLVKIDVQASDNNNLYDMDGDTDANGNYVIGVLGGLGGSDSWQVQVSNGGDSGNLTNYIFSQPQFDQNGGTNISAGMAVLQNFTAILATNHITGYVKDNIGNPISGVGVNASLNINGTNYQTQVDTDTNGNYLLSVFNGTWDVSINCNGGDDSLSNRGSYACPSDQNVTNNNNNQVANFTVQPCNGVQITTTSPLPNAQQGNFYSIQLQGSDCNNNFIWSVNDPADFPYGLSMNFDSSGNIFGAPTGSGTFNFSVHVDDGNGHTADTNLSLTINPQPVLGLPAWRTNQFQMRFTGASNQNYTVQMSTNLSFNNWISLFITNNPTTNAFLLTDPNATNKQRFYRILIGP